SLKQPVPTGLDLDLVDAHDFLGRNAASLEDAGFGVIFPAWWIGKNQAALKAKAKVNSPKTKNPSHKSFAELIQVDWSVALGDQTLTIQQLEALAELKQPLLRINGKWVQINQQEIQQAIQFLNKEKNSELTLLNVMHLSAGADFDGMVVSGVEANGWV